MINHFAWVDLGWVTHRACDSGPAAWVNPGARFVQIFLRPAAWARAELTPSVVPLRRARTLQATALLVGPRRSRRPPPCDAEEAAEGRAVHLGRTPLISRDPLDGRPASGGSPRSPALRGVCVWIFPRHHGSFFLSAPCIRHLTHRPVRAFVAAG